MASAGGAAAAAAAGGGGGDGAAGGGEVRSSVPVLNDGSAYSPGMSLEEARAAMHAAVDWVCDFRASLAQGEGRVLPDVKPGDVLRALPTSAPEEGEAWDDIMGDFKRLVVPAHTQWQHPNFYAFFPQNTSEPGLLGEFLCGALGGVGFSWMASPAMTELETCVMDWLARLLDLPDVFMSAPAVAPADDDDAGGAAAEPAAATTDRRGGGSIQGTASEAVLVCLIAARRRVVKAALLASPDEAVSGAVGSAEDGGPATTSAEMDAHARMCVYTSDQAHSSVKKAVMVAGLPLGHFRTIPTDASNRLDPAALRAAIRADREAGLLPGFVVASVGATSTTAVDPISEIADVCNEEGDIWLHIDAAYAGTACILPEYRPLINGVEKATSFNFNPHKWLMVPFDCSALWVTDSEWLVDALSVTPAYLRTRQGDAGLVVDYKDWQIPLGRRFRALKVWFVLRTYGRAGLQAVFREHLRLAGELESWIEADPKFVVVQKRTFALVSFRLAGEYDKAKNEQLLNTINDSGKLMLTQTVDNDLYTIRWSVGGALTREEHLRQAWTFVQETAAAILGDAKDDA